MIWPIATYIQPTTTHYSNAVGYYLVPNKKIMVNCFGSIVSHCDGDVYHVDSEFSYETILDQWTAYLIIWSYVRCPYAVTTVVDQGWHVSEELQRGDGGGPRQPPNKKQ